MPEPVFAYYKICQRLPLAALPVLFLVTAPSFERSMLFVWSVICSNNACDMSCVCSFRMLFLLVFVCLYIPVVVECLVFGLLCVRVECPCSVSYTHLDVYKRQVLMCMMMICIATVLNVFVELVKNYA